MHSELHSGHELIDHLQNRHKGEVEDRIIRRAATFGLLVASSAAKQTKPVLSAKASTG
jgi:hypothetical protein